MWTVQEAKAKLSEVLKRARQGQPQIIGTQDPCVVISAEEYRRFSPPSNEPHLGKWLVENAPHGFELELPSREDDRPDPFAWFEGSATQDVRRPARRAARRKAGSSRKRPA
jgi:prevent-host-death family protein